MGKPRRAELICFQAHVQDMGGAAYHYGDVEEKIVGGRPLMRFSLEVAGRRQIIVAGWKVKDLPLRGDKPVVEVLTLEEDERTLVRALLRHETSDRIRFWD